MNAHKQPSPKLMARLAGVFYLVTALCGIVAQGFMSSKLIIEGNASATASNILQNQTFFVLSHSIYLIEMIFQLLAVVTIYMLLKPAGARLATTAFYLALAACVIKTVSRVFYFAPMYILNSADLTKAFNLEQLHALSYLIFNLNNECAAVAMVFFGLFTVLAGYLMIISTYLPKPVGYLTVLGGAGWLSYLYPSLGNTMFPLIALISLLGLAALIFWLLKYGVNEDRWFEMAQQPRIQDV